MDDKSPTEQVLDGKDYESPTRLLMLQCKQRVKWEEAEQDELRSFHLCNVLSKTPMPEGVKPLPLKWIYKLKKDLMNIILRYKARLVAQGFFQVFGVDYTDTYSPNFSPIGINHPHYGRRYGIFKCGHRRGHMGQNS